MNPYIRFCIECGEGYDIDISKDKCHKCRSKNNREEGEDESKNI